MCSLCNLSTMLFDLVLLCEEFVQYRLLCFVTFTCRARRSEARIQQMQWKVNFSDIVFVNTVCVALGLLLVEFHQATIKSLRVVLTLK